MVRVTILYRTLAGCPLLRDASADLLHIAQALEHALQQFRIGSQEPVGRSEHRDDPPRCRFRSAAENRLARQSREPVGCHAPRGELRQYPRGSECASIRVADVAVHDSHNRRTGARFAPARGSKGPRIKRRPVGADVNSRPVRRLRPMVPQYQPVHRARHLGRPGPVARRDASRAAAPEFRYLLCRRCSGPRRLGALHPDLHRTITHFHGSGLLARTEDTGSLQRVDAVFGR